MLILHSSCYTLLEGLAMARSPPPQVRKSFKASADGHHGQGNKENGSKKENSKFRKKSVILAKCRGKFPYHYNSFGLTFQGMN